jgi:hypothetical protein
MEFIFELQPSGECFISQVMLQADMTESSQNRFAFD